METFLVIKLQLCERISLLMMFSFRKWVQVKTEQRASKGIFRGPRPLM